MNGPCLRVIPTGRRRTAAILAAALTAAMLAACSSTAKRVPVPYAIELRADPKVNQNASGRPSPVQVTIYELKSASIFESRDFFTLQGDAHAALGAELLNVDQVILKPGETKVVQYPGNAEARVVGVVRPIANWSKASGGCWCRCPRRRTPTSTRSGSFRRTRRR